MLDASTSILNLMNGLIQKRITEYGNIKKKKKKKNLCVVLAESYRP